MLNHLNINYESIFYYLKVICYIIMESGLVSINYGKLLLPFVGKKLL